MAKAQTAYPRNFTYNGNPLARYTGAADPSVHVWDGTVWMFTSLDHAPGYEAMDGYHAFSSTDMVNWTDHGEVFNRSKMNNTLWGSTPAGYMWAPGAARKQQNGVWTYYLYYPHYTGQKWVTGVATAPNPWGPYTDKGPVKGPGGVTMGMDPMVYLDDDGEHYIYANSLKVAKLNPDMISMAESPRSIIYAPSSVLNDETLSFSEGSYMHKKDGVYYFSYSNFHNRVNQGFYSTGGSPYGPFTWQGAMAPRPTGAQDHHSIIEFQGQWYYFYHIAVSNYPAIRDGQSRIACFDKLYYNANGTIKMVIETLGPTSTTYTLSETSPNGSVTFNPAGPSYSPGTVVTLTAVPNSGYTFSSWSGDLSGSTNPTTITMNGNKSVTANFTSDSGGGGILPRTGWVASASASAGSSPPANALDGNIATRWSTGTNQVNGQWFQVDMVSARTFNQVVLDAGSSSGDYPRGYRVNVSNDGSNWGSPVATGSGSTGVTTISFSTQTARYIRVTQTGSASGIWWSIHEFNVYAPASGTTYTLTETSPNGIVTFNPAGPTYTLGTVVTVTATPNSGYVFTGWSGDLSGSVNPTTITMNGNKSVMANFTLSGSGLPSPWQTADIGAVGATGSASYLDPTFTIKGSGADIISTADEFRYVSQSSSGDCSIVARVASMTNTHAWAKSGVMIRESTAANASNMFVFVTPTSGVTITWRATAGGTTNNATAAVTGQTVPKWLKLTRTGNVFAAYRSDDGTTWTQVGTSQTIGMATSATLGLALTSHADGTLCTSTMDNVTATP